MLLLRGIQNAVTSDSVVAMLDCCIIRSLTIYLDFRNSKIETPSSCRIRVQYLLGLLLLCDITVSQLGSFNFEKVSGESLVDV